MQRRISKAGHPDVRRALYKAASALMTRFKGRDKVQMWGPSLAKRSCHGKATVAVARKLAGDHARHVDGWNELRRRRGGQRQRRAARAARKDGKLLGAQALARARHLRRCVPRSQTDHGAPLRRMRTGADQGRRNARYLACGRRLAVSLDYARVPVMMLRHFDGKVRRDGSRPATRLPD